jgi:hypothetical protein
MHNQQSHIGIRVITLQRTQTSLNRASSSSEIDLAFVMFPPFLSQIFADIHRQRHDRKGEVLNIHPSEHMAPLILEVKSPYSTWFLFRTLMFTAGEDRILELLTQGVVPSHHEPVYGENSYYPTDPSMISASGGAQTGLNPYAVSFTPTAMTSWGHPIRDVVS